MTGVVLRCPNCGTVRSTEGQCEACHEASVRYFCTNHAPGVWLESAACPQCGARFGDPTERKSAPVEAPITRPAIVRPPATRPADDRSSIGPWDTEAPPEYSPADDRAGRPDPLRVLLEAMMAASRARSARVERPRYEEVEPVRRRGGGCFGRLLMLIVLIIAFIVMAPLFLSAFLGFG